MRFLTNRILSLAFGLLLMLSAWAPEARAAGPLVPRIRIEQSGMGGGIVVASDNEAPNSVVTVQASPDLSSWTTVATLHDAPFRYTDPSASRESPRFYRVASRSRTSSDDWRNGVRVPWDPFLSAPGNAGGGELQWIKFAIVLSEPSKVYYQESRRYPFHYEFATARLAAFKGMSRTEFDRVSLRTNQQQVLLGAVLFPPRNQGEYGIQFVGADAYPREFVARFIELVKSTVVSEKPLRAFYVPVLEQAAAAAAEQAYFEGRGIPIASAGRWALGDSCYATGWAVGRLRFVPGTEIAAAYADGRLGPGDILLTDAVPAEVPFVAGIVTLSPSTPNSHVAILARSSGIPFVHLLEPGEQERARGLVGREVALRSMDFYGRCRARLMELEGGLDPSTRDEIQSLKAPAPLQITPKSVLGSISAPVDALTPADIRYFGGKASNFGFLRRTIPGESPEAIAFSFDLWDAFMSGTLPDGRTLRVAIRERLAGIQYPPDMAQARGHLAAIRGWITGDVSFGAASRAAVLEALARFDPTRKIRFRSSTNVEDTERFTGAGLYDSFSGCLADDTDGDDQGPSACDASENSERGVFRALRKVYASFYNDNAWLERLRHGIDESQVGMAVLVHYSVPDEFELANGVATVTRESDGTLSGRMVTQVGALSVTNPEGNALPEVVRLSRSPTSPTYLFQEASSSLVPLGGHVLAWEGDYKGFVELFRRVMGAYGGYYTGKRVFTLDFEYKKVAPGVLSVKQVRELPAPPEAGTMTVLAGEPVTFCVFQGEHADVFATHRLKTQLRLRTATQVLARTNELPALYVDGRFEYRERTELRALTGPPSAWPGASGASAGGTRTDRWVIEGPSGRREFTLMAADPRRNGGLSEPLFSLADFDVTLEVRYSEPQPILDPATGGGTTTLRESVRLVPCPVAGARDILVTRTMSAAGGLQIETSFYWPEPPDGPSAGYTAPLVRWDRTTITGLTTEPIILSGNHSGTYVPGHHNFWEEFLFEPRLEAGISPRTLAELEAANIQAIYAVWSYDGAQFRILGLDGRFRTVPAAGTKFGP